MNKKLLFFSFALLVLLMLASCGRPAETESEGESGEHIHTNAVEWQSDAIYHWYTCEECGEEIKEKHDTDIIEVIREATCLKQGLDLHKCKVCEREIKINSKALGHDEVVKTEETPSTCITHGWSEKRICKRCNGVTANQTKLPTTGHTPDGDGYCTYCGTYTVYDGFEFRDYWDGGVMISATEALNREVVIIPTYSPNGEPIAYIDDFSNNPTVKKVIVQEGISRRHYGNFSNCAKLEEIVIPRTDEEVDYYGFRFDDCVSLKSIVLPDNILELYGFNNCISLKNIIVPQSVEEIQGSAFMGSGLEKIELPKHLKTISWSAFRDCKSIKEVVIPDSVETVEYGAFAGCSSLERIIISDNVKELGQFMLQGTGNIKEIKFSSKVTKIPYAFLKESLIEKYSVPTGITSLGSYAFFGCEELRKIELSDTVKVIEESCFEGCGKLTDVKMSKGLIRIGDFAFYKSGITSAEMNEGLVTVSKYAFAKCEKLEKVTLPKSVKAIERKVFSECGKLSEISYNGTIADWNKIDIDRDAFLGSSVSKIVCADGIIEL